MKHSQPFMKLNLVEKSKITIADNGLDMIAVQHMKMIQDYLGYINYRDLW